MLFPVNCLSSAGVVNCPGSGTAQSFIGGQGYSSDSAGSFPLMTVADVTATDSFVNGFRYAAGGALRVVDATSALPANTVTRGGLAFSSSGQLCINAVATPTSDVVYVNGVACTNNGRVYVAFPWSPSWITEYWHGLTGITVTGAGVSAWVPIVGTHSLTQGTDTNRPAYAAGVLTFDGSDNFLTSGAFTQDQPYTFYWAINQLSWTAGDRFFDGIGGATFVAQRTGGASPEIAMFAGSGPVATNSDLVVGTYAILTAKFNGASSSLRVNLGTRTTGNAGAGNAGGFALGATAAGAVAVHMGIKGGGYALNTTDAQDDQTVASMMRLYGIP